jgi:hypothetical protein
MKLNTFISGDSLSQKRERGGEREIVASRRDGDFKATWTLFVSSLI